MIGIKVDSLRFSYPNRSLFRELSFQIQPAEKIAFFGQNGSGKTTLLKLLSTQIQPEEGSMTHFEADLPLQKNHLRAQMGVLLDESHFLVQLSVLENLRIYWRLYKGCVIESEIDHWLERFGLGRYRQTPFGQLSSGEQKRVGLIKSLFFGPKLVILDEPTNALDETSSGMLSQMLKDLRCTVLVSTHQNPWAESWCNRKATLSQGKINWL